MKTVLLDIDNTLVYCSTRSGSDLKFELSDATYNVFIRENLNEFFEYLFKNFNVGIYTSATSKYANCVVDILSKTIDLTQLVKPILTRDNTPTERHWTSSCSSILIKSLVKASELLNCNVDDLILIDDCIHEEHPHFNQLLGGKQVYWDSEYRVNNILNLIPQLEILKNK